METHFYVRDTVSMAIIKRGIASEFIMIDIGSGNGIGVHDCSIEVIKHSERAVCLYDRDSIVDGEITPLEFTSLPDMVSELSTHECVMKTLSVLLKSGKYDTIHVSDEDNAVDIKEFLVTYNKHISDIIQPQPDSVVDRLVEQFGFLLRLRVTDTNKLVLNSAISTNRTGTQPQKSTEYEIPLKVNVCELDKD